MTDLPRWVNLGFGPLLVLVSVGAAVRFHEKLWASLASAALVVVAAAAGVLFVVGTGTTVSMLGAELEGVELVGAAEAGLGGVLRLAGLPVLLLGDSGSDRAVGVLVLAVSGSATMYGL